MKLVPCTERNLDELCLISTETFVEAFGEQNSVKNLDSYVRQAFAPDVLLQELMNPQSFFFLAYADRDLAGYLKLNLGEAQSENMGQGALEVERIYTLRRFKRRGLGRTMMDRALNEAVSRALDTIWLGVWEHNSEARKFYDHLGFIVFGSHVFTLGGEDQIDLLMKRDVCPA